MSPIPDQILSAMEDSVIPSISSGAVGSRFESQSDIDLARQRRDEQWKAAYARIGQEPPPQPKDDAFDGRSLAEKLAANRIAKQEEWEERNKLGNQFRALEEDEVMFLDSIREAQYEEERKLKEQEGVELKGFRAAVAARTTVPPPNPVPSDPAPKPKAAPLPPKPAPRKDAKKSLKGVIVRKKPKVVVKEPSPKLEATKDESDEPPAAKKRKV